MKKTFTEVRRGLTEELTHKKLAPMVDSFVAFASKDLGIKSRPEVSLIPQGKESRSFGGFSPADNKIMIVTKNRHPMDIFRTLAHELVHCKQCEDGKIGKDIRKEGETGSPQENEANAQAGVLMRNYAKMYPNMFDASYVTESFKVVPKSGREYYTTGTNKARSRKYKEWGYTHPDGTTVYGFETKKRAAKAAEQAKQRHEESQQNLKEGINDPGNNKAVFLFGGPGSGKDYILSQTLQNLGLTELNSDTAFEYLLGKAGLDPKMPDSEAEAREPVRARAKQITKKKQKYLFDNNRGIIINGTGDDLEKVALMKDELERRGYDTKGLMVHTSDEVSKQRNIERGERGGRTVPEDIRQTKWDDVQANRPGFAKLFSDDYTEVDNTADLRKVDKETRERKLTEFGKIYSAMSKWSRTEAQAPAAQEYRKKEMQARGITQEPVTRATRVSTRPSAPRPASVQVSDDHLSQARRLGLSYFGFGRFGRNIKGKNVVTHTVQNDRLVAKPVKIQENLRQWFSKTHPKGDWVRLDTEGNIKGPCAREEGEGKPKCLNRSRAESMPKEKRAKAARRKRRKDPVADREGKGGKPVMVATEAKSWAQQAAIAIAKKKSGKYDKEGKKLKEEILSEKNEPTNPELWSRAKSLAKKKFDVYPSAYANGWAAKWYKSKGGGWKTVSEQNVFEARRKRKDSEPDEENVPMSKTSDTGGTSKVGYPTRPMAEGMISKFFERRLTPKAKKQLTTRFLEQRKKHEGAGGKITPGEIVKFSLESTARRVADDLGIPHRTAFDHLRKAGHLPKEEFNESVGVSTNREKLIRHVKRQGWSEVKSRSKKHKIFTHPDYDYHLSIPHGKDIKYGTGKEIFQAALGKRPTSMVAENLDSDFEMFLENAGEWGTDELAINYTDATPGQEYWKKKKKKKDVKEDYAAPMWYGFGNSDGKSGLLPTATRNTPMTTSGFTGAGPSIPMAEEEPVVKSKKKKKNIKDIRNEAENNLYFKTKEQGLPTNKGPDNFVPFTPAGVGSLKEAKSPAWTRKEGQSETGGLNRKGIESYRKANPGSKLSMAVTTKPSKLKKGSKAANRRKSFCARMSGMKKRLTSAKTARDPNSRINKSLRKWNCEE